MGQFGVNYQTIERLSRYIPDHLLDRFRLGGRGGFDAGLELPPDKAVQRFIIAYKDLDFGFRLCKLCADNALGLPPLYELEDEPLWRCWLYCLDPKKSPDPIIRQIIGLMTPEMAGMRATLKGMLLAREATHANVAAALRLDPAVVRAFEVLFFNVLGRKQDLLYLQTVVYPEGRLGELNPGYLRSSRPEHALMRAGLKNGFEDVLYWSGASTEALDNLAAVQSSSSLEKLMTGFGVLLARNGELNQSGYESPGLMNARQVIAAQKMSGESGEGAMFDLLMGQALKDEIIANRVPAKFREDIAPPVMDV